MVNNRVGRTQRHREKLFREQRGLCFYCQRPMLLRNGHTDGAHMPGTLATLDHIIPISNGGAKAPTLNTVAACRTCNGKRGTKDARLFMLERQGAL